jgi:hypothetical protein
VPFVRFARDKRGYEYVYLVHESTRGGRPSRPAVLYWYRTPPGIKIGRPPFDEEVRQRLEAQNPEVRFDWRAITSAQPPPPDAEHWRERRRAEKALKLARLKEERADADEQEADDGDGGEARTDTEMIAGPEDGPADESSVALAFDAVSTEPQPAAAAGEPSSEGTTAGVSAAAPARSRRRRRGRQRRQRQGGAGAGAATAASTQSEAREAAAEPALADPRGPEDVEESGPEEPEDS